MVLHKSSLGQQPVINVRRRTQYTLTLLYGEPLVGWYPHSHTGFDACHRAPWYASVVHTCHPNEPHARPRTPVHLASPTDFTWASWLEIIFCIAGEYPTNLSVAGRSAACMCSSFCFLDIFTCQHSDVARVTALCSSVLPFRKPWWLLLRPEAVQARAALAQAYCDPTHPQSLARVPAALERGLFASEDIRATRQAPFLSLPLVLTFGRSPHQIWLEHGATSLACSRVWNLLSKMHAVSARLRPPPLSRNDVGAYIRF